MKKKITEGQLRNIIKEAVMNEIMTGGYLYPNGGLTGMSVEDFRTEIGSTLKDCINKYIETGEVVFDDELRQAWRDATNRLAEAMFKSKQTKEFRNFKGLE